MNSAQMVVLTDNTVVSDFNIIKDLEMSKIKKPLDGGLTCIPLLD